MRDSGGGSIVNISSVAAVRSGRWESAYSASKAGVDMLTRVAADEWGRYGIRVNSVLPGLIRTDTALPLTGDSATHDGFVRQTPLGRLGEPHEIAAFVVFLLSEGVARLQAQSHLQEFRRDYEEARFLLHVAGGPADVSYFAQFAALYDHRSGERRVGKERRSRWAPYH